MSKLLFHVKVKRLLKYSFLNPLFAYFLRYSFFLGGGGPAFYYVIRGEGVSDFTQLTTIGGEGVKKQ